LPRNHPELHNAIMALAVHAPPRGRVTPSMLPKSIVAPAAPGAANGETTGRANGEAGEEANDRRDGNASSATDATNSGSRAIPTGQRASELTPFEGPLEDARRAFESRYIKAALARAGGSPSRAASNLGLTRQGLKKLMARLGLDDDAASRARRRRPTARKERSPP
jgi:DNA-binding NtrC family response regulator